MIYADSKGALVGVEYDYYEEAGLFPVSRPHVPELMPIDLWTYFVFYVNESGAYYVDYMAFSGFELPPLAFYKGWLYLFLPASANTSFPMKHPPCADHLTVIRYCNGAIQKIGEVPQHGDLNISMPYVLIYEYPIGNRSLYRVDESIKLVAVGNEKNLSLEDKFNPYDAWLHNLLPFDFFTLRNRKCLPLKIKDDWIVVSSKYRIPLKEGLKSRLQPVNDSCAITMGDGLLIVPPGRGIAYFNGSMWVEDNYTFHSGDYRFIFSPPYLTKKYPPRPMNVLIYLYENNTLKELPLIHVSEEGVTVTPAPVKYRDVYCCSCPAVHGNWTVESSTTSTPRETNYTNYPSSTSGKTESSSSSMSKNESICGVGVLALLSLVSLILLARTWNP